MLHPLKNILSSMQQRYSLGYIVGQIEVDRCLFGKATEWDALGGIQFLHSAVFIWLSESDLSWTDTRR